MYSQGQSPETSLSDLTPLLPPCSLCSSHARLRACSMNVSGPLHLQSLGGTLIRRLLSGSQWTLSELWSEWMN